MSDLKVPSVEPSEVHRRREVRQAVLRATQEIRARLHELENDLDFYLTASMSENRAYKNYEAVPRSALPKEGTEK